MPPSIRRFLANIILKELVPINFLANSRDTILIGSIENQVLCPRLQKLEAALLVLNTHHLCAEDFIAVSYTHLTLPTILLV